VRMTREDAERAAVFGVQLHHLRASVSQALTLPSRRASQRRAPANSA
jgi:hypothetical protein